VSSSAEPRSSAGSRSTAVLPDDIRLGPVRLRVASVARSAAWLERVLGLRPLGDPGGRAAFGGRPGLYHYAILLPGRAELGRFLSHLDRNGIEHADADHLVSEAIYLTDPDGLTVEVYADRPREAWQRRGDEIVLATLPLDHAGLYEAGAGASWQGLPLGTRMGHVHHYVGDLAAAERFYVEGLGFAVMMRLQRSALFISAAGYHHHVGLNTWAAGRVPAGPDDAGLDEWTLIVPGGDARTAAEHRLERLGVAIGPAAGSFTATDPWGITVRVSGA